MSEHKDGCDGISCEDFECGICDCCGFDFEDPEKVGDYPHHNEETLRFCNLCASTFTSSFFASPRNHPELITMQTICSVGNAILQALERKDKK